MKDENSLLVVEIVTREKGCTYDGLKLGKWFMVQFTK